MTISRALEIVILAAAAWLLFLGLGHGNVPHALKYVGHRGYFTAIGIGLIMLVGFMNIPQQSRAK